MKRIFTLGIVGLILLLPQLVSAEEVEILDLTKSIVKLEAEILRIGPTDDNGGATINSSENELRDLGNGTVSGFRSAVTTGGRTSRHSKSNARTLPVRDAEYSSKDLISGGRVKQRRYYGERGRAHTDIDYFHSGAGSHVFPHRHTWTWNGNVPIRN